MADMKVVSINPRPSRDQCLQAIDALREGVASGRLVMFAAVAIEDNDTSETFMGCSKPVSRLRLIGACSRLLHWVNIQAD